MIQLDALSRRPDHIPKGDTDNDDVVMLQDSLFVNLINTDLATQIGKATDLLVRAIAAAWHIGVPTILFQLIYIHRSFDKIIY